MGPNDMEYIEVITDAKTSEQTIRPFTAEEVAAVQAQAAAAQVAARAKMQISFAQMLIGLVSEQWITEAEGEAWLTGTLPAAVLGLISTLPANQRFAARARAVQPSVVMRNDPLVAALGAAQGKTTEQMDDFFRTYAQV
jgi:hypothetical protein